MLSVLLLEDLQPNLSTGREAGVGECSRYSPRAGPFPPPSRLLQSPESRSLGRMGTKGDLASYRVADAGKSGVGNVGGK